MGISRAEMWTVSSERGASCGGSVTDVRARISSCSSLRGMTRPFKLFEVELRKWNSVGHFVLSPLAPSPERLFENLVCAPSCHELNTLG